MKPGCPQINCPFYQKNALIRRDGFYFRKDDSRKIARFKCMSCFKKFSAATSSLEFGQKKRRINFTLFKLLASGVSMRRSAIILNVHRTTIDRKFQYLAKKAHEMNKNFLLEMEKTPVTHMQFDDLITSVHTKLKPLTVSLAVDAKKRFILGAKVGSLPAFGHLAVLSRKKYGLRQNENVRTLSELFSQIERVVHPNALIESDEHKLYKKAVGRFFPQAKFVQYKGGRGCIVGQGELKKLHYDPLFKLNHACAMLRANINRLFRKTWCTTKLENNLQKHLEIFIAFHNLIYIK